MIRNKWYKDEDPLKVGDLVLVLDENTKRNQWRKGVIINIFPVSDGQVRIAQVKTIDGILDRSTRKLVKFLEVQNK